MKRNSRMKGMTAIAVLALSLPLAAVGLTFNGSQDFGEEVEQLLKAQSQKLFGFNHPLDDAATNSDVVPRENATAQERQLLAKGLKAEFVARNVARLGDMIAFWPNDFDYTHLIICIEQGREVGGGPNAGIDGENPGVQRVNVETGQVETILYGTSRCDGIRTTPWGTILATEETDDGRAYEILDPLGTTGYWVADRATGDVRVSVGDGTPNSGSANIVQRTALPTMAWEGLTVLANGVVIGGDELRPGSDGLADSDGGDRDIKSDGCVSMLSVADPSAEPTGFIFDGTGKVAYYIIQHGQQPASLLDFASNPVDGTTDDLMKISGFKNQGKEGHRRRR